VPLDLVGQVQRVDPRPGRAVEPGRPERDGLLVVLRGDVDHDAAPVPGARWRRRTSRRRPFEHHVEVPVDPVDDVVGTQPPQRAVRGRRVAHRAP
jgi:hypothetical protein